MTQEPAVAGSEDSIDDLVHQFSDPFAFYRELIQNSIDAGSTRIEVTLTYRPGRDKGLCTAAVSDWGDGMNRRIIEEYLVTKFRSAKENDVTKIGKFGIGFVSVFACAPDAVVVDTGRDGESWRVLFKKDRSYELIASREPLEGTKVQVHKELTAQEYEAFVERSLAAVKKWCRYSEVEVTFGAGPADGGAAPEATLLHEDLSVDAPFQVEHREEGTHIVVGPARALPPQTGFYNRGLTLLETQEPFVPGVAASIVSRHLEHTLTRDNVRRDSGFRHVLKLTQELVRREMHRELAEQSRQAAARPDGAADWQVIFRYAREHSDPQRLCYRLAGGGAVPAAVVARSARREQAIVVSASATPLTRRLTERDTPVLEALPQEALAAHLAAVFGQRKVLAADQAFTYAIPLEPSPTSFCTALADLLGEVGATTKGVLVASLEAAGRTHRWVTLEEPGRPLCVEQALRSPFARSAPRYLCLNAGHPQIAPAVGLFFSAPRLASVLVARCLLAAQSLLTPKVSGRLLERELS